MIDKYTPDLLALDHEHADLSYSHCNAVPELADREKTLGKR